MSTELDYLKNLWDLISQFVCWEFCRNADRIFADSRSKSKMDLISYFRDMVIEMTMKHDDSTITKPEILAKFIEELNCGVSSMNFESALQFVPALKMIFPELKQALTDLLVDMEELCTQSNSNKNVDIDSKLYALIREFSCDAFKLLPMPDLLEAVKSWYKCSRTVTVNPLTVTERLKKEWGNVKNVKMNESKILQMLASDKVYDLCLNDTNEGNSNDDERLVDFNDDNSSTKTTEQDTISEVSTKFEDCISDSCEDGDNSNDERLSVVSERVDQPAEIEGNDTLFYSCPESNKELEPRDCKVVLFDVAKSKNPSIRHFWLMANTTKVPSNTAVKESGLKGCRVELVDVAESQNLEILQYWSMADEKPSSDAVKSTERDPVWKHFAELPLQKGEKTSRAKCDYCSKVVQGLVKRMKNHFSICYDAKASQATSTRKKRSQNLPATVPSKKVKKEPLSSNSEEDFVEPFPAKKFRRAPPSATNSKMLNTSRRRNAKQQKDGIICHFCRKTFRSIVSLQVHDCSNVSFHDSD